MAYCNKDIQTMLTECQPTLSTIQHFTNNEYSRFSKDKDAIGQVAQAIASRNKKGSSSSKLQPSPASIHEQAMAAISLEDDDESDEPSPRTATNNSDENQELRKRLSQLEEELARLRGAADAAPAATPARRRASESVRRPLPPPIATNWASGPSASAPAGSKRMLSPSIIAPTVPATASAYYPRSPTHNSAIQTPEELIAGADTPKGMFAGLPQFKKIRQGASPESLHPIDMVKRERPPAPPTNESAGAGLVYFSPSHLAGMPQQPRSSDGMMLLCSPTAAQSFDKSPMHRGLSGLSPRVLLQPPSTAVYHQTMRPMSGRGMSMDLPTIFGAQAQAANQHGGGGQPLSFAPSSTQNEVYSVQESVQESASALSGLDTVGREDSWSLDHLLAPTQPNIMMGRPPLSPANGLCTPLGRGPMPVEGACAGLRV